MVETYLYRSTDPIILEPMDMSKEEWVFLCKILGIDGDKCAWISLTNVEGLIFNLTSEETLKEKEKENGKN